jgi:ABC-type Fe3+/spermidine/putrescine transport system ATPase subunit
MLKISHITKSFDDKIVLRDISIEVEGGEVLALLGPSGCGKTTLLRIVAGLETADSGQIILNGEDLTDVPVYRRRFGMVFQDYALFPHKTAAENIAFGLKMAARPMEEQQQRVALARALAPAPRLLLLDEPLGALDRTLRERLMDELRSILKRASAELGGQEKVTTLYVTHDQEEAFAVAGRVVVMNKGRIEQSGSPLNLYRSPATPFVARFLGMDNLLEAEVVSQQPGLVDAAVGRVEIGERIIAPTGSKGTLLIRPEAAKVLSPGESGKNEMSAEIKDISFRGRYQIVMFTVRYNNHSTSLKLSFDMEQSLPTPGGQLRLTLLPEKCRFFPME